MQLREIKTRKQRRASKKQTGYFISTHNCGHRIETVEKHGIKEIHEQITAENFAELIKYSYSQILR